MTHNHYRASILGEIWWPMGIPCSVEVEFTVDLIDDPSQQELDAAAIETCHSNGNFSEIIDCYVERIEYSSPAGTLGRRDIVLVKDWDSAETECQYLDTIAEPEEEAQ